MTNALARIMISKEKSVIIMQIINRKQPGMKFIFFAVIMICLFATQVSAKYQGPDTKSLAKTADVIVLARVESVKTNATSLAQIPKPYSLVVAHVTETLKGSIASKDITFGTSKGMEQGDYLAYQPGHNYLLFANKKDSIYYATHGRSGIFEVIKGKVHGWSKPGAASLPKPYTTVDYGKAKQEILNYLRATLAETDLEVFSAVLNSKFPSSSKLCIVTRQTVGSQKWIDHSAKNAIKDYKQIRQLIIDLNQRNVTIKEIKPLKTSCQVRLIDAKEIDRIFSHGYWQAFNKRFPRSSGLMKFSLPGYNKNRNTALVYFDHRTNVKSGYGSIILLERKDGIWKKKWEQWLWLS